MTFPLPTFRVPILMIYDIGRNTGFVVAPITTPERLPSGLAPGRETDLSGCQNDTDHRRRWREQRVHRSSHSCFGLSFSTRHQQMEQDRTPPLFHLRTARRTFRNYETIVQLIAKTTTQRTQRRARLDRRKYPTGRKVSNEEMKRIHIRPNQFQMELWNLAPLYLYLFTLPNGIGRALSPW